MCSKTLAETLAITLPSARKTRRVGELVRLFGYAAGGRVSERLLTRLGMPVSDNAIRRQLKSHVRKQRKTEPLRAIAIDDWSWRKGFIYRTIVVDLERRTEADVMKTRSAEATADWLKQHLEVEFVSRDRCAFYAQGIRKGAPSARQVADRFRLMQNLRESIEREMTSVSQCAGRPKLPAVAGDLHEVVRGQSLLPANPVRQRQTDACGWQDLQRYRRRDGRGPQNRRQMGRAGRSAGPAAPNIKPSSPLYFQEFLEHRWAAGDRSGCRLFHDVRNRRYIGSVSHLERLLSIWRKGASRVNRRRRRHLQMLSGSGKPRPLIRRQAGRSRRQSPPLSA